MARVETGLPFDSSRSVAAARSSRSRVWSVASAALAVGEGRACIAAMLADIALLYHPRSKEPSMTSTTVPATISTLLRAIEARDLAAVHAAFTPDAAIHDEAEVFRGPAG